MARRVFYKDVKHKKGHLIKWPKLAGRRMPSEKNAGFAIRQLQLALIQQYELLPQLRPFLRFQDPCLSLQRR